MANILFSSLTNLDAAPVCCVFKQSPFNRCDFRKKIDEDICCLLMHQKTEKRTKNVGAICAFPNTLIK